jgi:signal transduction histidine kinase
MPDSSPSILIETTQTLDTMLHQILNQALVAINARAGSLMLVDNRQGILQIKARLGAPRPGRKTERVFRTDDNSIAGLVVRSKKSYLCTNVHGDPHFLPSRSGHNFSSVLSVPIVHGGRVLAVINADAAEAHYFDGTDQDVLEAVARQVADPIAERISIIDALAEVGVELTRLPRNGGVERVLEKIAEQAVRSLGADVVTVYQYHEASDEFFVEGTGPTIGGDIAHREGMRTRVYPGDVPWTVVKERRPGFYPNVEKIDFLTAPVSRPGEEDRQRFVEREHIKSMAALLLPFRAAEIPTEEVVGVMFANYRSPHSFNIDETSALATFADYAAVAILNARHEEQRRNEQMKLVESVSANFAHRMSNLAGPSRVAVQLLRERIDPDDVKAHRQLDTVERQADVLLALAERLVRRFRETSGEIHLDDISVPAVLRAELQKASLDTSRIAVSATIPEDLPPVRSVGFQLSQVLHDIVKNAIEAMAGQETGVLTIRASANAATSRVKIEISDNGTGIPDEIRDRLFSPGVTNKSQSLGVGLWYSRTFLQATGGDIILKETAPGLGTTFLIEVPSLEAGVPAGSDRAISQGQAKTDVLIVDDEPAWRDMLQDSLPDGYSVKTAASYGQAFDLLTRNQFRLLVVDVHLGQGDETNKDGLKLIAEIDRLAPNLPVVVVTKDPEEVTGITGAMLLDVISKTGFQAIEFRELVRRTLPVS